MDFTVDQLVRRAGQLYLAKAWMIEATALCHKIGEFSPLLDVRKIEVPDGFDGVRTKQPSWEFPWALRHCDHKLHRLVGIRKQPDQRQVSAIQFIEELDRGRIKGWVDWIGAPWTADAIGHCLGYAQLLGAGKSGEVDVPWGYDVPLLEELEVTGESSFQLP